MEQSHNVAPQRQTIINNNVGLTKASRVFDVPTILTTVETKAFSGNMWPQIQAVSPGQSLIERSTMNSWDDRNFVSAIEQTGRKKILLTGLWTETCVALPTVQMIHDGYEIYVVEDCCGDVNPLAHDNAMKRMFQAGVRPMSCERAGRMESGPAHHAFRSVSALLSGTIQEATPGRPVDFVTTWVSFRF